VAAKRPHIELYVRWMQDTAGTQRRRFPGGFKALFVAARTSDNPCDFALVCLLGLLGLRIFEACAADIADLGRGR
jgi:hypothetical protein